MLALRNIPSSRLSSYLDKAEKASQNKRYKRLQLEKYLDCGLRTEYAALEQNGIPAAIAALCETSKNCICIAQLTCFQKGFGKALLKQLSKMFPCIYLHVDIEGGQDLENYYGSVLPDLGWKKFKLKQKNAVTSNTYWIKGRPSLEKKVISYISESMFLV